LYMCTQLPYSMLSTSIMLSIWVGAFVLFVASFSLKFNLAELPIPIGKAPLAVGSWLRRTGSRVSADGESIVVRGDSFFSVRLTFRPTQVGTCVRAQAWASSAGWSVTMISLFIWYFSIAAAVATSHIFLGSMRYAVGSLLPGLKRIGTDSLAGREVDIHSALLEGLSEARRLASEAYEGTRSNYEDAMLLAIVGGIVVFMISLAGATLGYADILLEPVSVGDAMAVSFLAALGFTVAALWFVRRRYTAILLRLKDWMLDLDVAFQMEMSGIAPVDSQRSTIETMADAWKELPSWLSARRKSSAYREPGTWILILSLLSACWYPIMLGVMMLSQGSVNGVFALACGSALVGAAAYVYVRWKRSSDSEDSRTKREWSERSKMIDDLFRRQLMGP